MWPINIVIIPTKEIVVPNNPRPVGLSCKRAQEEMSTTKGEEVTITVLAAIVVYLREANQLPKCIANDIPEININRAPLLPRERSWRRPERVKKDIIRAARPSL
jgi:hypothetical protein